MLPIWVIFIILPIFPFSLFVWVFILIVAILLLVPWTKIRYVIKIRKSIVYLFSNILERKIIRQKFYDIISHTKSILKKEKPKK